MPKINQEILGENLRASREALPLTREQLADMLQISVGSIVSLEGGLRSTTFRIQNLILDFFGYTFDKVGYEKLEIPFNFREIIIERHSGNKAFSVLLTKVPTIPFAIQYKLLKGNFLDSPKETQQIKKFFDDLGWVWEGTAIATALSRSQNKGIVIKGVPGKGRTFQYGKEL